MSNADREMSIFLVQLTTNRIDKLTRLIHTLAMCVTIHTYMSHIRIRELLLPWTSPSGL